MTRLSVSVAMATYNGARFIREQLDSIAAQTFPPLEVVICDDGSTDETLQIAAQFAEGAPFPVHIHRNPRNLRFARNFRKAASLCRGDLIAFCDQDDSWDPKRLETCVPAFADRELLLLYHNAWLIDSDGHRFGTLYDGDAEQRALELKPIGPWNHSYGLVQIFRSSLRDFDDLWDRSLNQTQASGPMDILSHDQWFFLLAEALGRATFLDERLLEYRQHGSNVISAKQMRPSFEARLLARLEHYGDQDLRNSQAAEARSAILRALAKRVPDRAKRLLEIADCYTGLAAKNRRRYAVYSSPSAPRRMAKLLSSWRGGDYSGWPWGFDRRSVIRDLWSGVLLAKTSPPAS